MPAHTILLVEDDPALRLLVRNFLARLDYTVLEADTVAKALALARGHQPDLVLLDLELPDGDGFVVAQELRRHPATNATRIVLFSAQSLSRRRGQILTSICDGAIPKPVTFARLAQELRLFLGLHRPAMARRFPRFPVETPTGCRPRREGSSPGDAFDAGVTRTLSEGGLMVELGTRFDAASLLEFRLRLAQGEVAGSGRVVWSGIHGEESGASTTYQHGIEFLDMDPEQRTSLQRLLQAEYLAAR